MRILHVIWNLGQGGAQKYLFDLLNELKEFDDIYNEVLVLSVKGPLSSDIESVSDQVHYLGMKNGRDIPAIFRMFKYLQRNEADLIHSHSENLAFNIIINILTKTVLYTEHGGKLLNGSIVNRWVYRYLHPPIHTFIAISKFMADRMFQENPRLVNRIHIVYNGVDTKKIKSLAANKKGSKSKDGRRIYIVGIIGRLIHMKGVDYFLETARRVINNRDDVIFAIVGNGQEEERLKDLAKQKKISDEVIFYGYRKDAIQILKTFDLFLFTSRFEPFGLVLTEAMAAGVTVVAMDMGRGAVREIVSHEHDGIIVDGPDCGAAANWIIRLLEDDKLRSELAVRARKRICRHFSIERNAKDVYGLYCKALSV